MKEFNILSKKHTEDWTICMTDVSIGHTQSYGFAIFRDHKHRLLGIATTRFSATNPTLVESLMMVNAAEFATRCNYRKVLFLCDNSLVVNNFNSISSEDSHHLLEGSKSRFLASFHSFERAALKKIDRKSNFMAHNMEKWARINEFQGEVDLLNIDPSLLSDDIEWIPDLD